MTSRRSPLRPSSGSKRAAFALLAAAAALQAGVARADRGAALKETRAGADVDWEAGTIAATGGAAADLRMPSVDLSRPGAQRRAQAAAVAKLRAALASLPLGPGKDRLTAAEIDRAVGRARPVDVQYQSNGGAVVRVEIRFGDWLEAPNPAVALELAVPSSHLGAAPSARVGKRDVRVGAAVYRVGDAKAAKKAAEARVDKDGRLVLAGDTELADKLARGLVMIYVGKLQR
jgi:hypothetical protein